MRNELVLVNGKMNPDFSRTNTAAAAIGSQRFA